MGSFQRIVVTGDCLRPDRDGTFGGINTQTLWLYHLIGEQVRLACGKRPEVLLLDADRGIDAAAFYARLGMLDPMEAWPRVYDLPEYLDAVTELYRPHLLRDCVCVGFELPKYLRTVLNRLGVPYLDFWIHPIRFLDDLLLACHSSDPDVREVLRRHALREEVVWITAGERRASLVNPPRALLPDNTLLVAGQTRHDKTQIMGGAFFDVGRHADAVRQVIGAYAQVIVKGHPAETSHGLTELVRSLSPDARSVSDNVYYLLAQESVAGVLTVNSSVAVEAGYFGKRVHRLAPPPIEVGYADGPANPETYMSLQDVFLNPDFWRDVLAPFLDVTPRDGYRRPPKPNRLRTALWSFWDFNRIDTDIAGHLARPPHFELAVPPEPRRCGVPVPLLGRMSAVLGAAVRQNRVFRLHSAVPPGIALFGPYLDLEEGEYRIDLVYEARTTPDIGRPLFDIDVCSECGQQIHARHAVGPAGNGEGTRPGRVTFTFLLPQPTRRTEVRVWNRGGTDLEIRELTLTPERISGTGARDGGAREFRYDSGERQTGSSIDQIRRDHRARYELACEVLGKAHGGLTADLYGLDVFCGNGYGTRTLAERLGCVCLGIGGSGEAIARAREFYGCDAVFFSHQVFPFRLPPGRFDFVTCFESLEHVEDDRAFLKALSHALRPEGWLLLSTPNENIISLRRNPNRFHHRHYPPADLIRLAEEAGLWLEKTFGQDVYILRDGLQCGLIDEAEMLPFQGREGQFQIYVFRPAARGELRLTG